MPNTVQRPSGNKMVYNVEEVASLFNVSKSSIYQMVKNNQLKAIHIGRAIRIPVQEVKCFLGTINQ